jgi:heterogeneous nuclear ribonucleoprotein A1/A3
MMEIIAESQEHPSSLFVGDLSIFCSEEHLRATFSCFGIVEEAKVIRCETTLKNLCYGFVRFDTLSSASAAMEYLNGQLLYGRPMR